MRPCFSICKSRVRVLQVLVQQSKEREKMWRDKMVAEVGKREEVERKDAIAHDGHLQELEILRLDVASKE